MEGFLSTTYSVTYIGENGTTVLHTDANLASGSSYTMKNANDLGLSKVDYTLKARSTTPGGQQSDWVEYYTPNAFTTATKDLVLYVQWETPMYFIFDYRANGGSGDQKDLWTHTNLNGKNCIVRAIGNTVIVNPGHDLAGWNTKPDGSGTRYVPGDAIYVNVNSGYPTDYEMVLYAQWQ